MNQYIKTEYNVDQSHFVEIGIEFYIAGRICYCKNFIGTYLILPILFHHAIEYFIKADLSFDTGVNELMALKHNLIKLWIKFKEKERKHSFDKYDSFIRQFNNAQKLRYPKGNNLDAFDKNNPYFYFENKLNNFEPNSIGWSVDTVDEIIYRICEEMRMPLSPINWIEHKFDKCEELFKGNQFFQK